MKPPITLAILTTLAIFFIAEPAFACAVCFDAKEGTREAFLGTTILLSLLPLAMVGGVILWLWRRSIAVNLEGAEIEGPEGTMAKTTPKTTGPVIG